MKDHFDIKFVSDGFSNAECISCKKLGIQKNLKITKSNLTGLKRHLESKHKSEYLDIMEYSSTAVSKYSNFFNLFSFVL